jgi:hypothetical protein
VTIAAAPEPFQFRLACFVKKRPVLVSRRRRVRLREGAGTVLADPNVKQRLVAIGMEPRAMVGRANTAHRTIEFSAMSVMPVPNIHPKQVSSTLVEGLARPPRFKFALPVAVQPAYVARF